MDPTTLAEFHDFSLVYRRLSREMTAMPADDDFSVTGVFDAMPSIVSTAWDGDLEIADELFDVAFPMNPETSYDVTRRRSSLVAASIATNAAATAARAAAAAAAAAAEMTTDDDEEEAVSPPDSGMSIPMGDLDEELANTPVVQIIASASSLMDVTPTVPLSAADVVVDASSADDLHGFLPCQKDGCSGGKPVVFPHFKRKAMRCSRCEGAIAPRTVDLMLPLATIAEQTNANTGVKFYRHSPDDAPSGFVVTDPAIFRALVSRKQDDIINALDHFTWLRVERWHAAGGTLFLVNGGALSAPVLHNSVLSKASGKGRRLLNERRHRDANGGSPLAT